MQHRSHEFSSYSASGEDIGRSRRSSTIDLEAVFGAVRRQWPVILLCFVSFLSLGVIYLAAATPLYTSQINVLIDRDNSGVVERLSTIGGLVNDEASVLSQLELLRSDALALSVVDRLKLTDNPEFMAQKTAARVLALIMPAVGDLLGHPRSESSATAEVQSRRRAAARSVQASTTVTRVGRSYLLEIAYLSASPKLSVEIVNALGEAYLVDRLNSKYAAMHRAGTWLQDRMAELRKKVQGTDLAIQRFRSANGLLAASSVLLTDQQLSEFNRALIGAQSDAVKSRAKLQRIERIIGLGEGSSTVMDVLGNPISNELQKKYLEASRFEAQLSSRFGSSHLQVVKLRGEMEGYKRLMFEELHRIAEGYRSEVDVAEARERTMIASVEQAADISATANETQVELRELEREADIYRNLYQTFLQRFQETTQQQSFPITEARIISPAMLPDLPSHPRKPLILALFGFIGMMVGGAMASFRELREIFFRTPEQVREELGMDCLGLLPTIKDAQALSVTAVNAGSRQICKTRTAMNHVLDNPSSLFAETLRSVRVAADLSLGDRGCKIIGVVSGLPGEGKTLVSVNLAELLASQGMRTVLIDGDFKNPSMTRSVARHAKAGLPEVLHEGEDVRNVLLYNAQSKLIFLPGATGGRMSYSSELLASPIMGKLLAELGAHLDYIVIDLPPLGPIVDVRAIADKVDGFLLVVEWGKTSRKLVRQILGAEPLVRSKCIGAVLNNVDQRQMKLYGSFGSAEFYHSRYRRYFR